MRMSDLQSKDIIDVLTGEKIGNVTDCEINTTNGMITKIMIYSKKGLGLFKKEEEEYITWDEIKKIGTDVILVNRKKL